MSGTPDPDAPTRATLEAEILALRAERARLPARLAVAEREAQAARAQRDAALRVAAWGGPRRREKDGQA